MCAGVLAFGWREPIITSLSTHPSRSPVIKMSISPCSLKTIRQPQADKSEEQSCFSFSSSSFSGCLWFCKCEGDRCCSCWGQRPYLLSPSLTCSMGLALPGCSTPQCYWINKQSTLGTSNLNPWMEHKILPRSEWVSVRKWRVEINLKGRNTQGLKQSVLT